MEIHAELGRSELENVHGQGDASKKKGWMFKTEYNNCKCLGNNPIEKGLFFSLL